MKLTEGANRKFAARKRSGEALIITKHNQNVAEQSDTRHEAPTLLYYYVLIENPYKVESVEFINELILLLYEGKADFISESQRIELKLSDNYFDHLRKEISSYEERLPLYEIMFNHIFLVYKENVYTRILNDNYRFVDKNFYEELLELKNPSNADKENIRFLSFYDLDVLMNTYMKIFYESFVLNSYITNCRRPSFVSGAGMEHISPYYSTKELYYLAYDWNLTTKTTLTESEIQQLCKQISQYDIPAQTLLEHQLYIYDARAVGLVKHYSLYGSYYMNVYLRKYACCLPGNKTYENAIRNPILENQINIMINLIRYAPALPKNYTVYRFVEKDDYMKHLNIGDIYQDPSFMSTTRNPFYYQENYTFGYILLKIKLPAEIAGVALSIEAYSNFPNEEEIILPPTSKFRLDRVFDANNAELYHHVLGKKIIKKYEFTWIGNDYIGNNEQIKISMPEAYDPPIPDLNMMELVFDETIRQLAIPERFPYFKKTFVNMNNQFNSVIGDRTYTFSFGAYNSTSVYKKFFYYEIPNGVMLTSTNPKYGNINIILELGPDIHVNYYFKYSVTDSNSLLNLNRTEWIDWLSKFAYVIGGKNVIIHSNYVLQYNPDDTIEMKQIKTRYTYSQNIYSYLKDGKKMFDQFIEYVIPNFDYPQLDLLQEISIQELIKPADADELYRISQISDLKNMREFYIYIVEKFPKLLKNLEEKLEILYTPETNPFKNISYTLNAWLYLYNNKIINQIPLGKDFIVKKDSFKKLIGDKKIPKFKNRLRIYLVNES